MSEATSAAQTSVSSMQTDMRKMQTDSKARNDHSLSLHSDLERVKATQQTAAAEKSMLDSKLLDMRRDMTLEKIRVDKTATSIHNIECKLAA